MKVQVDIDLGDDDKLFLERVVFAMNQHSNLAERCGLHGRIAAEEFADFAGLKFGSNRETKLLLLVSMLTAPTTPGSMPAGVTVSVDGEAIAP